MRTHISIKLLLIVALALCVGCKDDLEQKAIDFAKRSTFEACRHDWNRDDTSRRKIVMMVQLQFAKRDQLSLAPDTPSEAIRFWCNIKSDEAAAVEKQNRISGKDVRFD